MHGLLIIDKPAGLSSHDVIARARRILRTKRIGHTGTLDPFATGVLVLLIGNATRLAQFVNTDEKEYLAVARCGFATDTGDLTGAQLEPQPGYQPVPVSGYTIEQIEQAMAPMRGHIQQIPPMYSAKKVGGQKLYEMARRGEVIERDPVSVHMKVLEQAPPFASVTIDPPAGTWDFGFRAVCSSGTYIRTLAEEIGQGLQTGAHLVALRRTRAGDFGLQESLTLEQLAEAAETGSMAEKLLPPNAALRGMTALILDANDARNARNGRALSNGRSNSLAAGERVVLYDGDELLGIGEVDAISRTIKPKIMMPTGNLTI